MASPLNPYVSFPGTAREAMEFYRDVFGGNLTLNTFGELGGPDNPDPDKIMHGQLETDRGFTLMGADNPPGMEYQPGHNMVVSLSGDDSTPRRRPCSPPRRGGSSPPRSTGQPTYRRAARSTDAP
jgi:PhnB protein